MPYLAHFPYYVDIPGSNMLDFMSGNLSSSQSLEWNSWQLSTLIQVAIIWPPFHCGEALCSKHDLEVIQKGGDGPNSVLPQLPSNR